MVEGPNEGYLDDMYIISYAGDRFGDDFFDSYRIRNGDGSGISGSSRECVWNGEGHCLNDIFGRGTGRGDGVCRFDAIGHGDGNGNGRG